MLDAVKLAMRPAIKTNAYDADILDLIDTAKADLQVAGILVDPSKPLIKRAIITYCRLNFGTPENPDLLKASYDEQKAQLQSATGYTDWGDDDGT